MWINYWFCKLFSCILILLFLVVIALTLPCSFRGESDTKTDREKDKERHAGDKYTDRDTSRLTNIQARTQTG